MMAKYTAVITFDTERKPVVVSDDSLALLLPKLVEIFVHREGVVVLLENGVEIPFPEMLPAFVVKLGDEQQVFLYPDATSVVNSDGRVDIP